MGNNSRFLLVSLILLVDFVFHINGFNVVRSGEQEIQYVDNSLDNNESVQVVESRNETSFDTAPMCSVVNDKLVDIDIGARFRLLKFNATWITRKYFWLSDDFSFESRYQRHFEDVKRSQKLVKVFILPHSHNDVGWLNTYDQYYYRQTKNILNNAVRKLTELPHMTFVWSEITYLAKWWEESNSQTREQLQKLVDEGRLEIATGGWVVPDEAVSSLYSLVSELTEGQQWVKNHLNISASYSWAIDPFGHSATETHLLKQSGIKGMVIQRLHYAWKHWLAEHKIEEFRWRPRWDPEGHQDIPCLTLPFDLYSIKHACGPEPQICLKFDFRNIPFEYGENHGLMTPITKSNIGRLAEELAAQYYKTASLTKHNVILVPLGDDFRYDRALEWDQQYINYMRLFKYINSKKDRFRMDVRFGTLRDYFEAVDEHNKENLEERPSLSGDFYPYGDVYVSGRPAYWTGFYGTRPYWKKFHRELENELRSAEILFTFANALANRSKNIVDIKTLSYKYQDLVSARQEFSIFAHHDGITGTSRVWTMNDYGDRLHEAYLKCISVQQQSLKIIYQKSPTRKTLPTMMSKDFMRERFESLSSKMPLEVFEDGEEYVTKLLVFNNLGWMRTEMVKVLVKRPVVQVIDSRGVHVPSQINPVFSFDEQTNTISLSERIYELVFMANLEPLATSVFIIKMITPANHSDIGTLGNSNFATVSCHNCLNLNESQFPHVDFVHDDLVVENSQMKLKFQRNGLLESVFDKRGNRSLTAELSFGMYRPTNKQSGAYLLKPILSQDWKYFQHHNPSNLIRISGPIMSQLVSIHNGRFETIKVNTTLVDTSTVPNNSTGPQGVLLETYVDFSKDYSNRIEVYMRFDTGLNSTESSNKTGGNVQPEEALLNLNSTTKDELESNIDNLVMYTDQNGFVCEKRFNIPSLEYEGNTYPVTTMAYIQDEREKMRFSVLVDRAHGFSSMQTGRVETLIERKNFEDDNRGMAEGVRDSRPTVSTYVLLLENLATSGTLQENKSESFPTFQPTLDAYKSSLKQNYPPNLFVFNEPTEEEENDGGQERQVGEEEMTISLISSPLPENVHLLNLRTISVNGVDAGEQASGTALLNLQYLLDFSSDLRQCSYENRSSDGLDGNGNAEVLAVRFVDVSNGTNNQAKWEHNNTIPFQINYLNVSRVVPTSLTGVADEVRGDSKADLSVLGVTSDKIRAQRKQSSSLLLNYKLHFE